MDRFELIQYKNKKLLSISSKEILISFEFDLNLININKIFNNCIRNIYNVNFKDFIFKKCNKFLPNVSSLLIHNIFSYNFYNKPFNYKKCNNEECKILLNNEFY